MPGGKMEARAGVCEGLPLLSPTPGNSGAGLRSLQKKLEICNSPYF